MLDFSSVAKGYALDCIASLFDSLNIKNYLIMIGGEVVVKGMHPEGRPWKIGISRPTADMNTESQTALSISNIAMATSGNYLRYYEKNGKRYAHTIDPISGYPVQHELLSATVFAPTWSWEWNAPKAFSGNTPKCSPISFTQTLKAIMRSG